MLAQVTLDDIRPIAIGAGILGTGGGGNPYLGSLHLAAVMREKGAQPLLDPWQLADDALVCVAGSIGAPTVSIEKLPEGTEMVRALRLLEEHIERRFDAVAIAEIGGANSMQPLIAGLQAGIPTIDSDSMGRAFPEIQMSSFLFGSSAHVMPFAMVDAADNASLVPAAASDLWGERVARNIAVSMGARAGLVGVMMSGAQVKAAGIHYTMSLAHHLGRQVIEAQQQKSDVPAVAAAVLDGRIIFRGKITDVNRRTTKGFARGGLRLQSFRGGERLEIEFQNEFLIAYLNGEVAVTTPDLICIVTEEEGEPVTTEALRYGTRVAVIAAPAPEQLKTEAALAVVGPAAFGYDVAFRPLPGGVIGRRPRGEEKSRK